MAGTIYLAFLNDYAPGWAAGLAEGIAEGFSRPVKPIHVTLDLKAYLATERGQYHATLILAGLLRHLPQPDAKVLGVTPVDLYIPVLTFVFGQSQLDGPGSLISTYRLRSEFYGLPEDEGLLIERTIKEAVHELGHSFGLVHCPDFECVMHSSSNVEEVDLKGTGFCRDCRREVG